MAGIYIHIPFCKQACHYCDFHFSTNISNIEGMVDAIISELLMRKAELMVEPIATIYFGGGTPSILPTKYISRIIDTIRHISEVTKHPEITLEANPDDLNLSKLRELKSIGINRLSIGIQTFDDQRLNYINRAHSGNMAHECLENAQNIGFDNVSADLIYAIPPATLDEWYEDLIALIQHQPAHISLYGLTIEEKTVFGNWHKKGKLTAVSDETSAAQYELAIDTLKSHGYEHYEVSNFAKPGMYSRHNTAYWQDKIYIGVGPGAHSYDQVKRSFNISSNALYIKGINQGTLAQTIEHLTDTDKINDYIFTHLRTNKGITNTDFISKFGLDFLKNNRTVLTSFHESGHAILDDDKFVLTSKGFLIADEITWRLFYDA